MCLVAPLGKLMVQENNDISSSSLSEELYTAIGRFVTSFASVELQISGLLLNVLNTNGPGAHVLVEGMSTTVKVRKVKHGIYHFRKDLKPCIEPLNVFIKTIEFRNRLLHWHYFVGDVNGVQLHDMYRNPLNVFGPVINMDVKELNELSDWLAFFSTMLMGVNLSHHTTYRDKIDVDQAMHLVLREAPPIPKAQGTTVRMPL